MWARAPWRAPAPTTSSTTAARGRGLDGTRRRCEARVRGGADARQRVAGASTAGRWGAASCSSPRRMRSLASRGGVRRPAGRTLRSGMRRSAGRAVRRCLQWLFAAAGGGAASGAARALLGLDPADDRLPRPSPRPHPVVEARQRHGSALRRHHLCLPCSLFPAARCRSAQGCRAAGAAAGSHDGVRPWARSFFCFFNRFSGGGSPLVHPYKSISRGG